MIRTLQKPSTPIRAIGGSRTLTQVTQQARSQRAAGVTETTQGTVNLLPRLTIGQSGLIHYAEIRFGYRIWTNQLTILAGTLRIHMVGKYDIADKTITLSGSTEWVYVQKAIAGATASIAHASTEPSCNDPIYWNIPLYTFVSTSATSWKRLYVHNLGDINIGGGAIR